MDTASRARPSSSRLFRGYGPLIAIIVAFGVMALLAPTVAPEELATSTGPVGEAAPGVEGSDGATATTTAAGEGGTGGDGGTGGAAGGPASGAAGVVSCSGPQVQGDPYSPPCKEWKGGDNGGATTRGVSDKAITLAWRDTGGPYDVGAIVSQLTGERISLPEVTREDVIRTYEVLIEYFNRNFELYGRKLQLAVFKGKGSLFDEILGGGQSGANADAISAAQEVKAFADISVEPPVYADALARQKVISTNPIYPSREFFAERHPYAWGVYPDCTKMATAIIDFGVKKLVGSPVAAGEFKGKPRKIGIVYPESPLYKQCGDKAVRDAKAKGLNVVDTRLYRLSLDGIPPDARDIASAFANKGVTTVVTASDPLLPYFMTATAEQNGWSPEWIQPGLAFQDMDFAGQLYEPAQWKNAYGISLLGPTRPARAGYGYAAYRTIDSKTSPVELLADAVYYQLYLVTIGVQMAGPNLTPDTFAAGMRAYRPAQPVGPAGAWGFPEGDWTAPQDVRLVWWDPAYTSPYNSRPGGYREDGKRYPIGQLPGGPLPFTPGS